MAPEQGDAEAQFAIGCIKLASGRDSPENYAEAAKCFSKAAEQGHAKAQNQLGYMYFVGQGVPKDYAKAVQWCRKSADQGSSMAQSQLGYMYANGLGLVRNDAEAVRWYRLAAEQGREASQYNLGVMYSAGRGVTQDYKEAVKWYRLAADQGYAGAQHSLALMYENGQGVAQDNSEAKNWYRKLAEQGDADAQAALKRLDVGLTGFFKRLAQYYAEFLSTDFKKQRLPRRRLENSDAKGRLVGIPLRKYAGFQQKLWEELAKPIGTGLSLTITRGSWRSALPKAIMEAIAAHID
jgi:TPR repeat protein